MDQIGRIFILSLFWFKLDLDWYVLIGFGPKLKINNISFISPIHFNFFFKYDKVPSVLFTLKGFIHRYKNYRQITLIKFIFLFLLKKYKNLLHVFWCVLLYYRISQRFISKIQLCLPNGQCHWAFLIEITYCLSSTL